MRYLVQFRSGNTITIDERQYLDIIKHDATKGIYINMHNVDYIVPTEMIENAKSGVIRQPSPQDLRDQKEKDRLDMMGNPQALIADIRLKAESDNENENPIVS